ncbi:MAG: nitrogenase iron protein [Clostridiales Family XIII bacterium]|jgi:nitrogenase iron protein NifH|nr:nitrogenase iron protein [Clostridiales Family XIII bacterium]
MRKIAIYGKGGIGKSTITSNLSAALSERFRVMQIGCDPKADSTSNLTGGRKCPTVLDSIKEKGAGVTLEDVVFEGYNGTLCVEAGGPTPGIGCAGLGIIAAFKKLEELHAYEIYTPDIVLYDVLGDVVCGGFAMPIRGGYADHVFIVTSGEAMALFAARNIALAVENFTSRGYAKYSGVILNSRNVKNERALAEQLARDTGSEIIAHISRSSDVQLAEEQAKTVIEALPDCEIAHEYRALADKIVALCGITEKEVAV